MANPLTGDFEAVLQVSGGTINRLLASMHQNAGANPETPTLPHSAGLRIGDPDPLDGVRGSAWAQIGAPQIELIHGSTDRFGLEVGVRARYKPDPGSEPLPEFIHGTIRAQYVLDDVDPDCWGWRGIASEYVWPRVVNGSVSFSGTAYDDDAFVVVASTYDPAELEQRIAWLVTVLLETTFAATPQKISKPFRRGTMRSLDVPIGGSAVAVPISLDGGDPVGQIGSLENLILEDKDFGVAVSREYVMSLVQPMLAAIDAYEPTVPVHVAVSWPWPDIDTVYRVHTNPPSAEWIPQTADAIVRVKASGSATTDSVLPNTTFDIVQDVRLEYDTWAQKLTLWPATRTVKTHATGLGSGEVSDAMNGALHSTVDTLVKDVCAQMQGALDVGGRLEQLASVLRRLDAQASARVTEPLFLRDGIILRGRISLAPRKPPQVEYAIMHSKDAFSAFASWIPGGRVDELAWSWTWANHGRPGGSETWDDRFLLRRPSGASFSPFGVALDLSRPLPGLDGSGRVCLELRGKQVDSVTGELEYVQSGRECTRFGLQLVVAVERPGARLPIKEWVVVAPPGRPPRPDDPLSEVGIIDVAVKRPYGDASNTLIVYLDDPADDSTLLVLQKGLEWCRRVDAGLLAVVLVPDGLFGSYPQLLAQLQEQASALAAPAIVNEDVRGSWSALFSLPAGSGEPAWRLLGPTGSLTWRHDGRVGEELAGILDDLLFPSPPAAITHVSPGLDLGVRVPPVFLDPSIVGIYVRPCPPPPLGMLGKAAKVAFVQQGSEASGALLSDATGGERTGESLLVVVADGADEEQAAALQKELGGDLLAIPDPAGVVAERFGIRYWPTTVTLDKHGVVIDIAQGAATDEPPEERHERSVEGS